MQFGLVICGLDSVEARRWMNATLVNLVNEDNMESLKPMIDGGTEGKSFTVRLNDRFTLCKDSKARLV
jgi:molybdopterin/thiamine biosynthesis adenylyltransferase